MDALFIEIANKKRFKRDEDVSNKYHFKYQEKLRCSNFHCCTSKVKVDNRESLPIAKAP